MDEWLLVFYTTANGRSPVQEYLDSLDSQEARKVSNDLDKLRTFGLTLGAPYIKNIKGKLWELRTTGQRRHRVLYFAFTGRRFVLLHAFTKKTSKTPQHEIDTALRRMVDYQERENR